MTPDRNDQTHDEEPENGILVDGGSIDTTVLGILSGATAQVDVTLPPTADEDDFADDEAVDDAPAAVEDPIMATLDEPFVLVLDGAADPVADDSAVAAPAEVAEIDETGIAASDDVSFDDVSVEDASAEDIWAGGDADIDAGDAATPVRVLEASDDVDIVAVEDITVDEDVAADIAPSPHAAPEGEEVIEEVIVVDAVEPEPLRESAPEPETAAVPAARAEEHPRATERLRTRTAEIALAPRRLGEFEPGRESADLLTADRLIDPHHVAKPEPEGLWQHFVYSLSGRRINLGDGRRARERKALDRRIAAGLTGGAKFVPVLSRKGGVGKTTITTLLGMALADARDDRVIAVDANPDRGTLADRIGRTSGKTVRDLVRSRDEVSGYQDISALVARDETRLDVLASDADPHVSEAFSDDDYNDVARLAAHYYSIVLTDTGTGIVHSVMGATLDLADELVIVAGLSVDEARLASETLTWLESNGYAERVRSAIVVLNTARPGSPLVRPDELEAHFRTRVRAVVRVPYDPHIATGSAISFRELQPETRQAARELAAVVVEGLRGQTAAHAA